jgi:translation initiation factor 2B subunit (eIF-2B alpha/beta/delta family)
LLKRETTSKIEEIIADKTSGSSELLRRINIYFLKIFDQIPDKSATITSLQKYFRPFQNIQQYLKQLRMTVHSKRLSEKFFIEFRMKSEIVYDRIFANSLPYLKNKRSILTISNSKTVYEILRRLRTENCKLLTVSESRPKFEGRILAKKLNKEKISVELITEAMSAIYVRNCDCVIIGADAVLRNRSVVNKVGSFQLALLCNYFQKPFYVITEKSKFSLKNEFRQIEESTDEVWKDASKGVAIKNIYFEIIPASLISKIITD